ILSVLLNLYATSFPVFKSQVNTICPFLSVYVHFSCCRLSCVPVGFPKAEVISVFVVFPGLMSNNILSGSAYANANVISATPTSIAIKLGFFIRWFFIKNVLWSFLLALLLSHCHFMILLGGWF